MLNKVQLIGHLGGDPEVRNVGDSRVAQFSLATSEKYKGKDGQVKETTEWHSIVMWRNLADLAEKYMHKGSRVYLEGKLRTRSWEDKSGNKRYQTDIVVDNVILLDKKEGGQAPRQTPDQAPRQGQSSACVQPTGEPEEDLPF